MHSLMTLTICLIHFVFLLRCFYLTDFLSVLSNSFLILSIGFQMWEWLVLINPVCRTIPTQCTSKPNNVMCFKCITGQPSFTMSFSASVVHRHFHICSKLINILEIKSGWFSTFQNLVGCHVFFLIYLPSLFINSKWKVYQPKMVTL